MGREKIITVLEKWGVEGIQQSDLIDLLGLSPSSISEILNELERAGIVVRKEIGKKVKRVWLKRMAPFPIENVLRVGILKAVEYPHVLLALSDIQKEGVEVHLEVFKNAFEATSAAVSGRIDIVFSPFITQIMFSLVTRRIFVWASCGFKGGGVAFRDGEIKKVGSSELSTMEYTLKELSEFRETETKYYETPEEMIDAIEREEVDAIAIWEPYLSMMKERGYKVILFSEKIGNYPCCTAGVNKSFFEDNRELFMKYAKAYKNASELLKNRFEEATVLLHYHLNFPMRAVKEGMKNFGYGWKIEKEVIEGALRRMGFSVNEKRIKEVFKDILFSR
jgi:predicted transcriptional regulator